MDKIKPYYYKCSNCGYGFWHDVGSILQPCVKCNKPAMRVT